MSIQVPFAGIKSALKGQKHTAQGSALGIETESNYALQGQQNNMHRTLLPLQGVATQRIKTPGRCPGL